jgi:hypothetical protein
MLCIFTSETKKNLPKDLHYLGEVTTKYLFGALTLFYYSNLPNNSEDKAEFERKRLN